MSAMNAILNRTVPVPKEEMASPYLEEKAGYMVHNTRLSLGVCFLLLVIVSMAGAIWKLASREPERIVVRIDPEGQAVVAPYVSLAYQPREPEVRHFLKRFITDHYSRVRATYKDAFQRKLYFLDQTLARSVMEVESKEKTIQNFLLGSDDEVEVYVTQVSVEDMRQQPYRARVDFEKVFLTASDRHETKREKYTAQVQFRLLSKLPDVQFADVNPLGLVINYERVDQAFQ